MKIPLLHRRLARVSRVIRVSPTRRNAAFTLVEVILAIGIAVGLLIVALVFYQQAAHLRGQLIDEAERLSALRLIFDRVSADLRAAFAKPQIGFNGTSDSMSFIIARAPNLGFRGPDSIPGPASDLREVSYLLTAALEGTNFVIKGLDRTEAPLLAGVPAAPVAGGTESESSAPASTVTSTVPAPATGPTTPAAPPLAEMIRFVRFRYWDGMGWLEAWDAPNLPQAVEISLGAEPLPDGELPDAYPYELFRRIVLLPRATPEEDWWVGL